MGGVVKSVTSGVSNLVGGLFGANDSPYQQIQQQAPTPTPPAATPAPNIDSARQQQQASDNAAMRRGRAATILTSQQGDMTKSDTGTKKLLGG